MIPKDAFQYTSPEFWKAWSSQDDDIKVKLIKSIQDPVVSSPDNPTMVDANTTMSTAMVPWKPPCSANLIELLEGPVTNDVIQTFRANTSIKLVCELQAFSSQVVAYNHSQPQPLVFDINSTATKPNKHKKDKQHSTVDFPEGSIFNMFTNQTSGSKLHITHMGISFTMSPLIWRVSIIVFPISNLQSRIRLPVLMRMTTFCPISLGTLRTMMMLIVMIQ